MSSTRVSRSFYFKFFFNKQLFVIIKDVFFFWFFFEGDSGGLRWGIDWLPVGTWKLCGSFLVGVWKL